MEAQVQELKNEVEKLESQKLFGEKMLLERIDKIKAQDEKMTMQMGQIDRIESELIRL